VDEDHSEKEEEEEAKDEVRKLKLLRNGERERVVEAVSSYKFGASSKESILR
jgi:hypothetical protein